MIKGMLGSIFFWKILQPVEELVIAHGKHLLIYKKGGFSYGEKDR